MDGQVAIMETKGLKQFVEKYSFEKMELIRYCLEKGYDIEKYISPDFTLEQLEQIKKGFEHKVDVSIFANKEYSWIRMPIWLSLMAKI